MNQLKYCGVLMFLAILSSEDIREKRISVKTILIGALTAIICRLISGQTSGIEIVCSLIPGILLLLLSVITKESIGKGDGIVVMVLGLWIGGQMTFLVVCLAVWAAGIFAAVCLIRKRRELIPFIPCLLMGTEVLLFYV
ncbi:MAG: hypothetical protein HDR20_14570 [Lachnospiraceae bacterium]|nr:hypothetical protein [Lachnospiraceae bacterium]